jgi:2-polyprenyl-6-methoxyphenol hydroxylase-like FAD-dependent oxidoreductase
LYESLPEGTIRWGHRLKRVEDATLIFEHTAMSGFDVIVGADGAWSKVRPAVTPVTPVYSGVGGHQLKIPDAQATAPDVHRLINKGTVFAFDTGTELGLQQLGDGGITVNYWTVRDEDWRETCGYDANNDGTVRQAISDDISNWDTTLRDAVAKATAACQARSLYMLPVGTTWQHKKGVTLMGDAAHLMLHCAGEGVNLALQDARMLAKAIVQASAHGGLDGKIAEFEREMFKRATKAQHMTDKMRIASFFTPGAPRESLPQWILARAKYDVHPLVYPLAAAWFHIFYFFYKLGH